MIREYETEDKEQITALLKQGMAFIGKEDMNAAFLQAVQILVYEEKNVILGFCSLRRWGTDGINGKIVSYVVPVARKKGIGSALYREILAYTDNLKLNIISAEFRADKDNAAAFYEKLGFEKWFGLCEMHYNGKRQPVSEQIIVPYEDRYFEQYVEGMRNSFYEMRKVHDFQPYLCCECSEEKRTELANGKDDIFILLDQGKVAASASVREDDKDPLGPIFVAPAYQGRGYGKTVTRFAINEALRRGMKDINLEVVEWNTRAVNLYQSLGFEMIQTMHTYRCARTR